MVKRKMTLLIAGLMIVGVAFYISASTAFMALLLGLLFIPPALIISAALMQGFSIVSESFPGSEKEVVVISD